MRTLAVFLLCAALAFAQYVPPGGGGGSGNVVASGVLVNGACITGGGTTTLQTPATTCTVDSSGNISVTTLTTGTGSGVAGLLSVIAGSAPTPPASSFGWTAPATMSAPVALQSPNATPVAHQVMVLGATASSIAPFVYKTVPDCTDTAGQHLNFTQSTDGFSCGNSGGGGGGSASITRGAFAGVPSCTTSQFEYLATNYPGYFHCDGSSSGQWFLSWGPAITPAANVSFGGWINQSTASVATSGGSVIITGVGSGTSINARYVTIPSTPYSITACLAHLNDVGNSIDAGIFISDGTNASTSKLITYGSTWNAASGGSSYFTYGPPNWSNSTTYGGTTYAGTRMQTGPGNHCVTISDNGSNRKYWTSFDGVTRVLALSQASNTFLTPTHYGIYVNTNGSTIVPVVAFYSLTYINENI